MGYLVTTTHLNLVFVWKICILIVYITTSAVGRQNANLFSTKKIGNARDQTGFAQEHPSKSAIHCATSCQEKSECQTFSFDKKTKICKLGNASTGSRRMYKKQDNMMECPEQKGYLLWIYSDAHYCIKYNAAPRTQPEAKQVCEDDGGNLVLIDSKVKRLRLHDLSRELVDPMTGVLTYIIYFKLRLENRGITIKGIRSRCKKQGTTTVPGLFWIDEGSAQPSDGMNSRQLSIVK